MQSGTMTAERFDEAVAPRRREKPTWTLDAIGNLIGVGADFVKTLAAIDGSPIHEIGGRYYTYESELLAYMRRGGAALGGDQTR